MGDGEAVVPDGPGAAPGPDPQPQPEAPKPDRSEMILAEVQRLQQTVQQQSEYIAAQQRAGGRTHREVESDDDEPYIDPAVERRMAKREQALMQRIEAVQERADHSDFVQRMKELRLTEDQRKQVEQTYTAWRQNGITINGQAPSRIDALRYALGAMAEQGTLKTITEKQRAEEQRREELLSFATPERSGRIRAPTGLDPDKMSRRERLDKLYPAVLDDTGF